MRHIKRKTYDVEIQETRTYIVQATASSVLEAHQEGLEAFHRLQKAGELSTFDVSKPRVHRVTV